jgi:hypothetical protein
MGGRGLPHLILSLKTKCFLPLYVWVIKQNNKYQLILPVAYKMLINKIEYWLLETGKERRNRNSKRVQNYTKIDQIFIFFCTIE